MFKVDSVDKSISSINESSNTIKDRNNKINKDNNIDKDVDEYVEEESKEKLKEDIEKLNETVGLLENDIKESLKFELHEQSERMMVKVMNIQEHEVIKEMPPKEVLDLIGKIKEMVGVFLDEKV